MPPVHRERVEPLGDGRTNRVPEGMDMRETGEREYFALPREPASSAVTDSANCFDSPGHICSEYADQERSSQEIQVSCNLGGRKNDMAASQEVLPDVIPSSCRFEELYPKATAS